MIKKFAFLALLSVLGAQVALVSLTFSSSASSAPSREISSRRFQSAEITASVERINYRQFLSDELRKSRFDEKFDVNTAPGAFLLESGAETIAVSRWISPKRSRSYPYERVYDTLAFAGRKAALIPVVKDEGLGGDRDFLQLDTISLLSLLNVHAILVFYGEAEKNAAKNDRIAAQKFDRNYTRARLKELYEFKGSARAWNEREARGLKDVFEKAKTAYAEISRKTKTYLHDAAALDEIINYAATLEKFREFSRVKAQKAQTREFQTAQPKEALSTATKAKVTIDGALSGKYFFTCDETHVEGENLYLIEAKHSERALYPSKNDIKDGLLKLMLYVNLSNVKIGKTPLAARVMIRLTSRRLKGSINSDAKDQEIEKFYADNNFAAKDKEFFGKLFREAQANKFTIIVEHAETAK